ncbi:Cof-type HAD-IIB family hydrolase [Enterococcus faecalis]|uniref:Cof-type HAD-IIB family hydrolase n=1 Tax=Enterococcus faecalis TaxID=1351 RepID=UPI003CC5E7AB
MAIKAIVMDIDGTLLTSEKKISPKTRQALVDAQKQGLSLILASGRPTKGMRPLADELEMAHYNGHLLSYNGACVTHHGSQQQLFNQTISKSLSQQILEHLKQFDVIPMINDETFMYVNDVFHNTLHLETGDFNIIEYESRGGNFQLCEWHDLAARLNFPLNKILIAGEPAYLQKYHEAIYAPFKETVTAAFSAPFYFEFTAKNIDKARSLEKLTLQLGITAEEVIAFGDGHNDYTMLEWAGTGIAMENAVDELKSIATEVTLSNDNDGIAVALANFL